MCRKRQIAPGIRRRGQIWVRVCCLYSLRDPNGAVRLRKRLQTSDDPHEAIRLRKRAQTSKDKFCVLGYHIDIAIAIRDAPRQSCLLPALLWWVPVAAPFEARHLAAPPVLLADPSRPAEFVATCNRQQAIYSTGAKISGAIKTIVFEAKAFWRCGWLFVYMCACLFLAP